MPTTTTANPLKLIEVHGGVGRMVDIFQSGTRMLTTMGIRVGRGSATLHAGDAGRVSCACVLGVVATSSAT